MMKQRLLIVLFALAVTLAGCGKDDSAARQQKNYFPSWNNCEALTALQEYVTDVTNPKSPN